MPPIPLYTRNLMLACVAAYCLQVLLPGWFEQVLALWPFSNGFMPWQVVTYAFLHGDPTHLFFNMIGLWMFGSELEQLWGRKRYVIYLLASVLAAAAAQLLLSVLLGSGRPTVGASGALFGLLWATGMLFPTRTIVPLFPPIPMKARTFVMVFGALELVLGLISPGSGVAHFAHLGGMAGGWWVLRQWRQGRWR